MARGSTNKKGMMVHYALCDDQKTKIFKTESVCFADIHALLKHVTEPEKTHYIQYKPTKYQKGTEEQRRKFFQFISSLWWFPDILDGQTYDDVVKDGVYINVSEWDAWKVFNTLSMVRYMDEFDGCQETWERLCTEYPQLTPFQVFVAMHWFDTDWNSNFNHTFFTTAPMGIIDDLKPEDFTPYFPLFDGKSFLQHGSFLYTPNNQRVGVSPIFHKAATKYGTAQIPYRWGEPVISGFEKGKHLIFPKIFGPHGK